jgi:hypothetical protein
VVDLDRVSVELGVAETTCRTCRLTWRDDTPEFWKGVRECATFPGFCLACGASVPEWRVAAAAASSQEDRALREPARAAGR